jgi:hypothetical protein
MIHFGVIIDSENIFKWHLEIIEKIRKHNNCIPVFAILIEKENTKRLLWNLYIKSIPQFQKIEISSIFDKDQIDYYNIKLFEGNINLNTIEREQTDFIIDFTSYRIFGEISKLAKLGIWKFNFGDSQNVSDFPIGFHEILHRSKTIASQLVSLLDGDISIIKSLCIKTTEYSYKKTIVDLVNQMMNLPIQAIIDYENQVNFKRTPISMTYTTKKAPSWNNVIILLYKQLISSILFFWNRGFYVDHWNIGYINGPIENMLNGEKPKVQWFKESFKNRFIADPFIINKDGNNYILFEGLNYQEGVGYISIALAENDNLSQEKLVIKKNFHLSYPYLFTHNEKVFCIPETNEANEISLYEAIDFPNHWEKQQTLISNFPGIDSTLFYFNDLWWIFTTNKLTKPHENLYGFYCENIFGNWQPHKNNPIKIDIRSARGAGTPFLYEGHLYRPGQDYSEKIEGRIRINKILRLSPYEFEEEEQCIINPFIGSKYPHKTHTIGSAGKITIIDGCRQVFILTNPLISWFKLKRVLKHIFEKKLNR